MLTLLTLPIQNTDDILLIVSEMSEKQTLKEKFNIEPQKLGKVQMSCHPDTYSTLYYCSKIHIHMYSRQPQISKHVPSNGRFRRKIFLTSHKCGHFVAGGTKKPK